MTMDCERMDASLLAVIDGRAANEERESVEDHLAGCGACARRMQQLRAVWSDLDSLPAIEPSPAFDARLRARIAERPAPSRLFGWMTGNLRLVAVVAALVAVAVWISLRPAIQRPAPEPARSQQDFAVVKNLPVLENYDVVSNLDVLSDLPGAEDTSTQPQPMD
jgi:anti-sigma factor RsiW